MAPGTRPRAGRWGWIQAQAGQADDSNGLVTWNQLRKRGRSPKRLLGRPRMRSEPLSRRVTQTGMGTARQRRWSELWTSTEGQLAVRALPNKGWVLWTADASSNVATTSVCAGQDLCGAPAGIEPATPSLPWNHQEPLCGPPVSPGRARPSGPKLSVLLQRSYALSFEPCADRLGSTHQPHQKSRARLLLPQST
jgi:hypothetical protein